MAALDAALAAGHRVIEIDVAFTGPDLAGHRESFLGHYFSMFAAGGPRNKAPKDYSPQEIVSFKMRKRDQLKSVAPEDSLALLTAAVKWARQNQVLLMIDPKIPADAAPGDYDRIIADVLDLAYALDTLPNVAIKTTNSYASTIANISTYLKYAYSAYEGQFLWSPIPNKDLAVSKADTLAAIDAWNAGAGKQVITYELGLFSPDYWGATVFTDSVYTYQNLIEYIKVKTGRRSALWSIDPMGDKGTFGREYNWKFVGNTTNDYRGSPIRNLSYDYGRHVAINTDRPDWYNGMVTSPYP